VRLAIEPLAASLAAVSAADPELVSLRDSIAQMSPAAERGDSASYASFLAADTTFHETIARAGRNCFLAEAVHHLHTHHRLAFLYRYRGVTDWQEARREHALIAEAIAGREPEHATRLMQAHIERSRVVLRAGFDDAGLTDAPLHARLLPVPARPTL
jgi:DNA-binding GntR family transcriptional regulator